MNTERNTARALLALVALTGSVGAQTITVTISRDINDVPGTATIADLPGPDGKVSLNEALTASDNTPGRQTIGFAIPPNDWWLANIYPGQVLLQSTFGWSANEPVIIDGTTQTAFTGDTFPGGWEMSLDGLGLGLSGANSEIFGFHGCHVGLAGDNGVAHDNTGSMRISVGPFNRACVVRDNEADTIELTYSDDNVVIRNVTERVRITGYGPYGAPASGNRVGGPDPADRNFITGFGNYGEHGVPGGDCIELYYTDNTLIQNNYIGTTPDGMAISNSACTTGIAVHSANNNVFVRDNLIAIQAFGSFPVTGVPFGEAMNLELYEGGTGIEITGNTFGLNALGQPVLGSLNGIVVSRYAFEYGAQVRIGGPNAGEGNVIAGHLDAGVVMLSATGLPLSGGIRLSGNSIYSNGEIGIDLLPNTSDFGPTPNDALDADVGANGLQNYPEILAVQTNGSTTFVAGQLDSEPFGGYTLEFFASPSCDASGFGQGRQYLGSTGVATNSAGNATFQASLSATVPAGWFVTSTATREPVGATSEFSACVPTQPSIATSSCFGDGGDQMGCTDCPCANNAPQGTSGGCLNSAGTATSLVQFGTASIGAVDLRFQASGAPPNNSAVLTSGNAIAPTNMTNPCFGLSSGVTSISLDGLRCAVQGVLRHGVRPSDSNGDIGAMTNGWGTPNGFFNFSAFATGDTKHFQIIHRDDVAAVCMTGQNTSQAVSVTFTP